MNRDGRALPASLPAALQWSSMLIIGYGNPLRGDDAAGQLVAQQIEALGLPAIEVRICHQLLPELAEQLAYVDVAIFIDATAEVGQTAIQIKEITYQAARQIQTHLGDPAALLQLSQILYGKHPQTWQILIPTMQFEYGTQPSVITQKGIEQALEWIKGILDFRL